MAEWILNPLNDAAVDERLGLFACKLTFTMPSGSDPSADLLNAMTFVPATVRGFGLPLVKRDVKQSVDGGYVVDFHFDGVFAPKDASGEEYSVQGTTSEEPIETHPDFSWLLKAYNGTLDPSGHVTWPLTIKDSNGKTIANPMRQLNFLLPGLIWTRVAVTQKLPPHFLYDLGFINPIKTSANSKQDAPRPDAGRDWLKIRAEATWRGNVWRTTESWQLSGPYGWNPYVYKP